MEIIYVRTAWSADVDEGYHHRNLHYMEKEEVTFISLHKLHVLGAARIQKNLHSL